MAMASLAVFAAVTCILLVWRFEETLRQRSPQALQWWVLGRTWRTIGSHPTFWAYALLTTTSYCGLFTFLAASSFVFIDVLGESKTAYGLWVTTNRKRSVGQGMRFFVGQVHQVLGSHSLSAQGLLQRCFVRHKTDVSRHVG